MFTFRAVLQLESQKTAKELRIIKNVDGKIVVNEVKRVLKLERN